MSNAYWGRGCYFCFTLFVLIEGIARYKLGMLSEMKGMMRRSRGESERKRERERVSRKDSLSAFLGYRF